MLADGKPDHGQGGMTIRRHQSLRFRLLVGHDPAFAKDCLLHEPAVAHHQRLACVYLGRCGSEEQDSLCHAVGCHLRHLYPLAGRGRIPSAAQAERRNPGEGALPRV